MVVQVDAREHHATILRERYTQTTDNTPMAQIATILQIFRINTKNIKYTLDFCKIICTIQENVVPLRRI